MNALDHVAAAEQSFQGISISGHARVHLGNSFRSGTSGQHSNSQRFCKTLLMPSTLWKDRLDAIGRIKRREAVEGSGEWLLREPALMAWLSREQPLLWILGKPGSGKTFLAHNLIAHLLGMKQQDSTYPEVAYFFFQRGNDKGESVHQALKDIVFQISQQDASFADHLENHNLDITDVSTLHSTWRTFVNSTHESGRGDFKQVFVILDGLDEAENTQSQSLLELVGDLTREHGISLAILSRPDTFGLLECSMLDLVIHVDAGKNDHDISRYSEAAIHRSRKLSRLPADLRGRILRVADENSEGMFLYAKLLVADLERKQRMLGVEQALQMPPVGLENLFEEVIKNLTSTMTAEDMSDLHHILMWVAHAGRLLTLKEIDSMLRLNSASADDPVLDLEHKLRFQFGSLFELLREDGLSTSDLQSRLRENTISSETDQALEMNDRATLGMEAGARFDSNPSTTIVVFSHSSLLDFFTRNDCSKNSHGMRSPFALARSISKAQVAIFERCYRLLRDSFLRPDESLPTLSAYAKSEWMAHALSCAAIIAYLGADELASLGTAVIELLTSRNLLEDPRGWLQSASISYWDCEIAQNLLPLLDNGPVRENLSAETSNWLDNVSKQPITLFEPALQAIARQWLTHDLTKLKPKDCAIHLHVYRTRKLGISVGDANDDTLSPDAVEAAAEWAMLEKTLPWHWRVMECLCYLGHPKAALKHLEKFIEERSEWPPALCYLGRIFQKQQNLDVAMDYFSQAVTLATGHRSLSHKLRAVTIKDAREGQAQCAEMQAVSCWPHDLILRAHMKHKAAKFYSMCYRTLRDDHYYCAKAIVHLGDIAWDFHLMTGLKTIKSTAGIPLSCFPESSMFPDTSACYRLIMDILGDLQEDRLPCQDIGLMATNVVSSRLLVCLADYATAEDHFTRCIAFAAQRTGQLDWLIERYRDAILLAETSLQHMNGISLMNCLAVVLDDYSGSTGAALEVWREVIARKAPADITDWQMFKACQFARERLATACTKVHLLHPERLKRGFDDSETVFNPNLRWCRLLNVPELADRTMNDEECAFIIITEVLAQKASLNSRTRQALGLARFLANIGDFENATAAYSVYHEYLAGFAVTRTHRQSVPRKVLLAGMSEKSVLQSSNLAVCCDGPCRRTFLDWEGIVTCCTCIDIDYCKDCFKLLQAGEMGMTSCTMGHAFWEVPLLPEGTRFREGEVAVGDRVLSVEEWVTELQKQYCFSNNQSKEKDLRGDASPSGS